MQWEQDIHTSNEKSVTREYDALVSILHIEADAILRMTWGIQSLHGNFLSDFECFTILRSFGDGRTVLTPNDLKALELLQLR